jgi:osmotically-inducible protein OsmY
MKKSTAFLAGLGVGGAFMYMFDPDRGRGRREDMKDRMNRTRESLRETGEKVRQTSQRVSERVSGLKENARSMLGMHRLGDAALMARVRLNVGRTVSHPRAIDVRVEEGVVSLSGPILESEVNELMRSISSIRGVNRIENRLEVHPIADIPALQGESERVA